MMRFVFITSLLFIASLLGLLSSFFTNAPVEAVRYSSGQYGTCTYDTCNITLASDGLVDIDVTPVGGATRCTVQHDTVTATTGSSTGYLVTVNNTDTTTSLEGPSSNTIPSVSGSAASPAALSANTWGYRVDSVASFGAGPTTAITNATVPVQTYAATPSSASAGGTVRSTTSADITPVDTSVWYGVCIDTLKPAGLYTGTVLYTAVVNP